MRGKYFYVRRVVAHAFLGPPPSEDAWQVHHTDGNPGNNHKPRVRHSLREYSPLTR